MKKDDIKGAVKYLCRNREIALINPVVYNHQNQRIPLLSPEDNLYNEIVRLFTLGFLPLKKFKYPSFFIEEIKKPWGCCMLIKTNVLNEINLLDENVFLLVEEAILANKLMDKKYKMIVYPHWQVFHLHKHSSFLSRIKSYLWRRKSRTYFLRRYRKASKIYLLLWNVA